MNPRSKYQNNRNNEESEDEIDSDDEDFRTIFCGNLSERVSEEVFYELFLQAGPIESVRIPKDNDGKQRQFGFVCYAHKVSVPYALQLFDRVKLFHRELNIRAKEVKEVARNQPPNPRQSEDSPTPRKNPFAFDNSALTRGGSSSVHSRLDLSMLPSEQVNSIAKNMINPMHLDIYSQLSANLLLLQNLQGANSNSDSRRNQSNRSHSNDWPYGRNDPNHRKNNDRDHRDRDIDFDRRSKGSYNNRNRR